MAAVTASTAPQNASKQTAGVSGVLANPKQLGGTSAIPHVSHGALASMLLARSRPCQ